MMINCIIGKNFSNNQKIVFGTKIIFRHFKITYTIYEQNVIHIMMQLDTIIRFYKNQITNNIFILLQIRARIRI